MPDSKSNPRITKKVMEEFEKVRKSAQANMRDLNQVFRVASIMDCLELAEVVSDTLERSDPKNPRPYHEILTRYDYYMERYHLSGEHYEPN